MNPELIPVLRILAGLLLLGGLMYLAKKTEGQTRRLYSVLQIFVSLLLVFLIVFYVVLSPEQIEQHQSLFMIATGVLYWVAAGYIITNRLKHWRRQQDEAEQPSRLGRLPRSIGSTLYVLAYFLVLYVVYMAYIYLFLDLEMLRQTFLG